MSAIANKFNKWQSYWLSMLRNKIKQIAMSFYCHDIDHLRAFLNWYGFKTANKITSDRAKGQASLRTE